MAQVLDDTKIELRNTGDRTLLTNVRTMEEIVSRSTSRQRFNMLLMTIFGSVAVGIAAALALTRLLSTFFFGVKEKDPAVFITVAILLSLVSCIAVRFPARRATRIGPSIALRYE